MPLNAQILLSILAHETSSGDLSRTLRATPASYAATFSDGTGANQAQIAWSDSVDAAVEYTSLNLKALADDRGSINFSAIKIIYIRNTGASQILFGPYTENAWAENPVGETGSSGTLTLNAGCVAFFANASAAGWPVVGFSNLGVWVPAGVGKYEIVLIGEGSVS